MYGNVIWGSCGEPYSKDYKKYNRAARIITESKYDSPTDPLLNELNWKSIRELIRCDTAVMGVQVPE